MRIGINERRSNVITSDQAWAGLEPSPQPRGACAMCTQHPTRVAKTLLLHSIFIIRCIIHSPCIEHLRYNPQYPFRFILNISNSSSGAYGIDVTPTTAFVFRNLARMRYCNPMESITDDVRCNKDETLMRQGTTAC